MAKLIDFQITTLPPPEFHQKWLCHNCIESLFCVTAYSKNNQFNVFLPLVCKNVHLQTFRTGSKDSFPTTFVAKVFENKFKSIRSLSLSLSLFRVIVVVSTKISKVKKSNLPFFRAQRLHEKNFVHSWNGPWSEPKGQSWACTTEAQNRNQARLNFLNSPKRLQTQNMIFLCRRQN